MDEINPITGEAYTDEAEFKLVKQLILIAKIKS